MLKNLSILIILVLMTACSSDSPSNPDDSNAQPVGLLVGNTAPNFKTTDLSGKTVDLKALRGNVVLIDFWATWCGPCKTSMPSLIKIWDEFKGSKFKIIGVSFDHDADALKKYIADNKLSWTHVHDTKHDVNQYYNVSAIPHVYLLDKKGEIVFANHPLSINLREKIAELLGK